MDPILALDSSGKTAGVCVCSGDRVLYEHTLDEGLTHSETLLPLVQQAFAATGLAPGRVGAYAVTVGPGSFTGLRIALALVKGLALPHSTPAIPVSTLQAWAVGSGLEGTVVAALDARRGEVYWAAFDGDDQYRPLTPDRAEAVSELEKSGIFCKKSLYFVGDGAVLCYNTYNCDLVMPPPKGMWPVSLARGAALIAAKAGADEAGPADALRPRYLRLSQAERERARREAENTTAYVPRQDGKQ